MAKVNEDNPYLPMIKMIVEQKGDLAQLEKFMDLQERWESNQAKKEFARELSAVQMEIETIIKNKYNAQTKSQYSDLSAIINVVKPIYTAHGFSLSFDEGESPKEGYVRIIGNLVHSSGCEKVYHYDNPMDGKGIQGNANMIPIHGKASSTAYGKRYLTCNIFNIATEDKDGNEQSKLPRLTDVQQIEHVEKIKACKTYGELKEAYNYAIGQADILKDKESQLMFAKEKGEKMKELEKAVKK